MKELKIKIGGDASNWELAASRVRGEARRLVTDVSNTLGNRMAGLFTLGAIGHSIRQTVEYAGQLTDMSARTGVAVEALQRLDIAARENGTSLDALVALWERVGSAREDALRNPSGSTAKAFGALGVNQSMLSSASPDALVRKISEAFQGSMNVDQLISPLREIGGRGAGQMIAFFRAGLDQQYADMQVMTGAQAELLDELDDRWSTLSKHLQIETVPALIWVIEKIQAFSNKIKEISSFIGGFIGGLQGGFSRNGPGGPDRFFKDVASAIDEGMTAGGQAALDEVARQKAETIRESDARAKRARDKLNFGGFDPLSIAGGKQNQDKFTVTETKLDELSKAGLFAGGAGSAMADNIPTKQLAAAEALVQETRRTNDILEEAL